MDSLDSIQLCPHRLKTLELHLEHQSCHTEHEGSDKQRVCVSVIGVGHRSFIPFDLTGTTGVPRNL